MSSVIINDMSFFNLINNADFVVKLVILMMLIGSLICWTIIFDKILIIKRLKNKTEKFEKVFWSGQVLQQLYERVKSRSDHPIAAIFVSAMHELERQPANNSSSLSILNFGIKERIYQTMEVAKNKEIEKIEKNLNFLATLGSSAPFIGLFGTVWGIMRSFQSIAAAKNVTLAVVAPGIAEALLATLVGLFAAIPAVIFYNYFASKINRINAHMDDFINELGVLISRQLDRGDDENPVS